MAVQHLHFSSAAQQQLVARNLAESALHRALTQVLASPAYAFGSHNEVVRVDSTIYRGAYGLVSFDARRRDVPASRNNLLGEGQVLGSVDRSVPSNSLHLVARGHQGQFAKTLEALYYVPPFPSALASQGPFRSRGTLLVAGVREPSAYTGSYDDVAPEQRLPSHVFSNSNDPRAVVLDAGATIRGNVGAVGGIETGTGVTILGQVRAYTSPQPVPNLHLSSLFGRLDAQTGKEFLSGSVGDQTVRWLTQSDGNLHLNHLQLDNGILYVKGDLRVDHGITGEGAIYVQGQTYVGGGTALRASDQVALVSQGPIELRGDNSYFQGLVYSESEIRARNTTVLGVVIARGLGGLEMENVKLINSPVTVQLIEGLEMVNASDDDTVHIVLRVQERDPVSLKPTLYKIQMRGHADDHGTMKISPPIEQVGLRNYGEIKAWLEGVDMSQFSEYTKHSFHLDWYWQADPEHVAAYGPNPLQRYLDILEGRHPDPERRLSISIDPNQVLGVVERARVLLFHEIAN